MLARSQAVADFAQQDDVLGGFSYRFSGWLLHSVVSLHHQEHHPGDDEEIDDRLKKGTHTPVVPKGAHRAQVAELEYQPDQRSHDAIRERGNHRRKSEAQHERDG